MKRNMETKSNYLYLPTGPFRTKNSTAPEAVVFNYHSSFLQSVPFCCLLSLEKQGFLSTLHSVFFVIAVAIYLPIVFLLSVLFLVQEGPLGS